MKKILLFSLFSLLFLSRVSSASASTISLSPVTVSTVQGQTFSVTLAANPAGVKSYTVKAELSYPPALLEAVSFTPATGWLPLAQPGYDLVDNTNGKVIKTGGYTGGFLETKTFGTVTYKAKATGNATISVSGTSLVLDAQSKNSISGTQGASVVTISALSVAPTPVSAPVKKTTAPAVKKTTSKPVSTAKKTTPVVALATTTITATSTEPLLATSTAATTTTESSDQVAAVSEGFGGSVPLIVTGIVVLALLAWFFLKRI